MSRCSHLGGLKIYIIAGADTVVAASEGQALALWCEHTGEAAEDYEGELEEVEPAKVLAIWCSADGKIGEPGEGATLHLMTAGEWAEREGAGFLCSTEWITLELDPPDGWRLHSWQLASPCAGYQTHVLVCWERESPEIVHWTG